MKAGRNRKEIDLLPDVVKKLTKLAEKDKRKLKPYMEKVLEDHAKNHKP